MDSAFFLDLAIGAILTVINVSALLSHGRGHVPVATHTRSKVGKRGRTKSTRESLPRIKKKNLAYKPLGLVDQKLRYRHCLQEHKAIHNIFEADEDIDRAVVGQVDRTNSNFFRDYLVLFSEI